MNKYNVLIHKVLTFHFQKCVLVFSLVLHYYLVISDSGSKDIISKLLLPSLL